MSKHTRWFCDDCQRQWVFATNWNGTNCPTCGSPHTKQVTYTPLVPGADIGTTWADIPSNVPELPPPPEIVPERVHINDNQTLALARDEELALSSPEFE